MSSGDERAPTNPAPDHLTTPDAVGGTPYFKSVGGLNTEIEVDDYTEGGVHGGKHGAGEHDNPSLEFTAGQPKRLQEPLVFDPYEEGEGVVPAHSGALDAAGIAIHRKPPPDAALPAKAPGPPQRGRGSRRRLGLVLTGLLTVIVLGGVILTVVVHGAWLPFVPSGCLPTHGKVGSVFTDLADQPAPCAPPTIVLDSQQTVVPQASQMTATATALPEPTATSVPVAPPPQSTKTPRPQPSITPQPSPAHLSVTPQPTTAFCANGQFPSLSVKNTGGKTLTWSASGPDNPPITVKPSNGSLAPGAKKTVAVSGPYPTGPSVIIAFASNGGNVSVTYTCS